MGDGYWPENVLRQESVEALWTLFAALGYEKCDNEFLERGYDKVALYANELGPTHVARQLANDRWTSKLGRLEDIEHATLKQLEGDMYGSVTFILRRPSP